MYDSATSVRILRNRVQQRLRFCLLSRSLLVFFSHRCAPLAIVLFFVISPTISLFSFHFCMNREATYGDTSALEMRAARTERRTRFQSSFVRAPQRLLRHDCNVLHRCSNINTRLNLARKRVCRQKSVQRTSLHASIVYVFGKRSRGSAAPAPERCSRALVAASRACERFKQWFTNASRESIAMTTLELAAWRTSVGSSRFTHNAYVKRLVVCSHMTAVEFARAFIP